MYTDLDLLKIKKVYFIGIGGIGISAIARMMLSLDKEVLGQDMQDGEIVKELKEMGAKITIGQSYEDIPADVDLIVYTIAIEYYDPALFKKLKEGNIPIRSYPEMLGLVSREKYTIAVSGTHGKTTTTGMIAQILTETKKDPTVVIGSLIRVSDPKNPAGRANFIPGKSEYFVAEACEYRRSFLNVSPKILVIVNIDADHLDYYKDIEDIKSAFRELAEKVPEDGFIVCDLNDVNISDVIGGVKAKIINYQDYFNNDLKLKIPGIHNRKDAAAANAVASVLGISKEEGERALALFPGTWRRFEYRGETESGLKVYDDYAHHPAEVSSTLEGFRELYPEKDGWHLTVVFQPHLYSRTKALFDDFVKCFHGADKVVLLPIYFAREVPDETISSGKLAEAICEQGDKAIAFTDFELAEEYLKGQTFGEKDVLVTMGAGEAYKVADKIFKL